MIVTNTQEREDDAVTVVIVNIFAPIHPHVEQLFTSIDQFRNALFDPALNRQGRGLWGGKLPDFIAQARQQWTESVQSEGIEAQELQAPYNLVEFRYTLDSFHLLYNLL